MGCLSQKLVFVLHAAELANGQAFAGSLQVFVANILFFTRLQALGSTLVRSGYGTMASNIFPGFFVSLCYRKSSCLRK
jgi:hypothetical protein